MLISYEGGNITQEYVQLIPEIKLHIVSKTAKESLCRIDKPLLIGDSPSYNM